MKKMKRLGVLLIAAAMSASIVGCGGSGGRGTGGGGNKKVTTIEFCNFLGCSGDTWIKDAAARFSELKKEESYEEGKTGVVVNVTQQKQIPFDSVDQSGYDIFAGEAKVDAYSMAKKNFLLNLNDIVEPMEGQISDVVKNSLKGPDGGYYALPHYAWYAGASYDVGYFEDEHLYFADPSSEESRTVENEFGTATFINGWASTKSCGPDGEKNTSDDGLPSSLQELLILCEEINTNGGRTPINLAGACLDYGFFLADGLWASMAGPEQIQTIYSLDSEGELVDLVELDENGNIVYTDEVYYTLSNGDKIMKPSIVREPITEETGYRIYDMESRYYALAFLKIALDKEWFHSDVNNGSISNLKAQERFLTRKETAILYDASYWYSETKEVGNVQTYHDMFPGSGDPKVSFMCLPSQLEGSVTEGNGKKLAIIDIGSSQIFVNKKVENNPGKKRAVVEFLKFLYSPAELKEFTEYTGLTRPIDYDYDIDEMDYYFQELNKIIARSETIYYGAESNIFKNNKAAFSLTWSGGINQVRVGTTTVTDGFIAAMKNYGASVHQTFDSTRKTKSGWQSYLQFITES